MNFTSMVGVWVAAIGMVFSTAVTEASDQILSILNFKDVELPKEWLETKPVERKDLRPYQCEDISKLLKSGVDSAAVRKMIISRGTSCDPSADSLAALKSEGASDELLVALTEYALSPNRTLTLLFDLKFLNYRTPVAKGDEYVHVILETPQKRKPIRVISNLNEILGAQWGVDRVEPHKEGMVEYRNRSIVAAMPIPLESYGPVKVKLFITKHGTALKDPEKKGVSKIHTFELSYPEFSRRSLCTVDLEFTGEKVLDGRWTLSDTALECDWGA